MSFSYGWRGPNIVKDGLSLYLDAGSPNSYFNKSSIILGDASGGGNNGTLINGPTYDSLNGGSIVFDGVDDYINCGTASTATIRGSSQFTISYWFKKFSSGNDFILGTLDNSANKGIFIQWFTDSNIYFGVYSGSRSYNYVNLPYTSNWYNFTFTFDGSLVGSTNISKLYINSVQQSLTNSGGMPTSVPTDVLNLSLGKITNYSSMSKGNIAVMQVYNTALSSTEILKNYNALKTRFGL